MPELPTKIWASMLLVPPRPAWVIPSAAPGQVRRSAGFGPAYTPSRVHRVCISSTFPLSLLSSRYCRQGKCIVSCGEPPAVRPDSHALPSPLTSRSLRAEDKVMTLEATAVCGEAGVGRYGVGGDGPVTADRGDRGARWEPVTVMPTVRPERLPIDLIVPKQ